MKFVILRHATGQQLAIMGLGAGASHAELAAGFPKMMPVSAGFVRFDSNGTATVYGHSDSLCLKPHATDARFLTAFYRTSGAIHHQPIPA